MKSIYDNLENYKGIIRMLAEQFGSHCEVVLHDLTQSYDHTIVAIENGHITGRSIGDCGSNLGLQVLSGNESPNGLYRYYTRMPNGKVLKSSTCYLQDDEGAVIGAICINYEISGMLQIADILKDYELTFEQDEKNVNEIFANNVNELLEALIEECKGLIGKSAEYMSKQEKIEAIQFLDSRGAFLITKSGDRICRYLEISKNTLYSYLDIARNSLAASKL